ncbi:MAG: SurA N-terminal domain-containing protein [Pseudomonadota bacterium]
MKFEKSKTIRGLLAILSGTLLFVSVSDCTRKSPEEKTVAKINDYILSLHEFEGHLASELEMDSDFKVTRKAREMFLDRLIGKELLIQEAIRLKLDRQDKFIKAIERYWQSTLIRDLIALKSEEISKRTYVSQEEIDNRYQAMMKEDKSLTPLSDIREKIAEQLKEEKKTGKIKEWIDGLRKTAKIEINRELLQQ